MSITGFDDKFLFYGFLPKTEKEVDKVLASLSSLSYANIFFTCIKINFYLKKLKKFFSGRKILIAKEMTKIHETFYRDKVDNIKLFKVLLKGS